MMLPSPVSDSNLQILGKLVLNQPVEKADVIVWLQGDRLDRGEQVVALYNKKLASLILVTGNDELVGLGKRLGENDLAASELAVWLRNNNIPSRSILLDTHSLNTFEQARQIAKLSKQHGWKKIIIVTSPYHQVRTFLTVLRAFKDIGLADTKIFNQPTLTPWGSIVSGRQKTAADMWLVEQEKIHKYKNNLIDINEGIKYLENI